MVGTTAPTATRTTSLQACYDALANFEAPGGAAFRVAMIPSPVRVCSYLPDLWGWQRQAVLLGLNSDVHEWVFPTAALPARRCPAATDGEAIALSGGVGARLLVLRGFLAYSSFREPRA